MSKSKAGPGNTTCALTESRHKQSGNQIRIQATHWGSWDLGTNCLLAHELNQTRSRGTEIRWWHKAGCFKRPRKPSTEQNRRWPSQPFAAQARVRSWKHNPKGRPRHEDKMSMPAKLCRSNQRDEQIAGGGLNRNKKLGTSGFEREPNSWQRRPKLKRKPNGAGRAWGEEAGNESVPRASWAMSGKWIERPAPRGTRPDARWQNRDWGRNSSTRQQKSKNEAWPVETTQKTNRRV
jgi:hypothetical protein